MEQQLSPEALRAIDLATKLFEIKGCTEEEAQSRTAKAMELLARHNLDMATIGTSAKGAQRADKTKKGGLYQWQRDLWKASGELNFCVYFSKKGLRKGDVYEHRMVGRHENVVVAELMAEYLQQTIERHAKEYAQYNGYNVFCREMIAFREGMSTRLVERLQQLRRERLEEDKRKKAERDAAAKHPGAASTPGTALMLVDVMQDEADLNNDYLHGYEPGTTSARREKQKAEAADRAAKQALWEKDREEFKNAYGAELFAQYLDNQRRQDKIDADWLLYQQGKDSDTYGKYKKPRASRSTGGGYRCRAETEQEKRAGLHTHRVGYAKGNDVGLDTQVKGEQRNKLR